MKKQLALAALALCITFITGTSWAGPCAGGANPGPGVDCRGVNLAGAHLSWKNLKGADFRGASLYWTELEGADLRGANLEGANTMRALLVKANLEAAIWSNGRVCVKGSFGGCKWDW